MENFVFHNPTKIIFGRNTLAQIGPETAACGRKALLVYGRQSARANNVLGPVLESLQAQGLALVEHGGVQSNPLLSHVREGIEKARQHRVEVVVAVGGGSVIDSGKAICAGAVVPHDVWKFFTGRKGFRGSTPLPLTCVLTLAASGSEMNGGMVLTNDRTREKFGVANKQLHPRVSILDPSLTCTVPPDYTAYGAVDAIAHILEFYFTTTLPHTPVQDRYGEGLVASIMEACEAALADPRDYDARSNIMWAATLALNGLSSAGLGKVGFPMHLLEHAVSGLYDVPHGAGLSAVIPGWLRHKAAGSPEKIAQLAERLFRVQGGTGAEMAAAGIEKLRAWFVKVASPTTLAELGVDRNDIPNIAEHCLAQARIWRMPDYTREKIEEILHLCFE